MQKSLLPLTACVPELRTQTVDTMSSCSYLQNLLTISVSFSSSSHNSTAPESEATRIPLSPTQVRSATPASVWTPAEQKPSLGAAQGSLKSQREPAQQRPLRLEAPRRSAPSDRYRAASNCRSMQAGALGGRFHSRAAGGRKTTQSSSPGGKGGLNPPPRRLQPQPHPGPSWRSSSSRGPGGHPHRESAGRSRCASGNPGGQ